MSVTILTPAIVKNTPCPADKKKYDLFDSKCKGLMLEIRLTGGKTYYLRFQDQRNKAHQFKIADERDISLTQARQLADKYRSQLAMGEDPFAKKKELSLVPTMEAFTRDSYLPFAKTYKRSWDTDEGLIRNHLNPYFGKLHLDQIKPRNFIDFVAKHSLTHKPGSVNRVIILMRYIFNCAIRWEIPGVTKNPTAGIPLLEENNKIERYLSVTEANRLMDELRSSPNTVLYYIVGMLILTGARKREVLDAKWVDIDLERQTWRIPLTKAGQARHVPLSDGVITLLAQVPRIEHCPYVFANPATHAPFISVFAAWDTARTKAHLGEVRMHDLRHSFASFLVNSGRSLYEVQKILGHTQIKTTQRYAHLSQESLRAAANEACRMIPIFGNTVHTSPALMLGT